MTCPHHIDEVGSVAEPQILELKYDPNHSPGIPLVFPWYSRGGWVEHPNVDWFTLKVKAGIARAASFVIGKTIKWYS